MAAKPTLQYLAGLIDGDGCISLLKKKDSKTRSGHSYAAYMCISSNDKLFLQKLQAQFGGYVGSQGRGMFSNTTIWQLRFSSNEMRELLPGLIPHLILKKREAQLLLEGLTITSRHRYADYDPSGLDKIVASIRLLKFDRNQVI